MRLITVTILLLLAAGAAPAGATTTAPKLLRALPNTVENPTGYDRDKFNHWITVPGKGCDTREFVLYRQNRNPSRKCGDETGSWVSLYDRQKMTRSRQADIDHMVPLAEAWASGARRWTAKQREAFANDLYPFSLIAVSLSSNRSKSDRDPAEWLPTNRGFVCRYVARWTAVKYRWRLSVDVRERRVIRRKFSGCARSSLRLPNIKRASVLATQGGGGTGNTDPRFGTCTEAIAAGYGPYKKGVDREYWWYSDRDGDGIACER